jgi:hypothetical protein
MTSYWPVCNRIWDATNVSVKARRNLIPTITMDRLPTELVIQILSYMSKKELKFIGFTSSEYRSLVMPFLFRRIRPWSRRGGGKNSPNLIACLQNNSRLSSVVRVLDAGVIRRSLQPVKEIRQIMEVATWWEGLILPADRHIPFEVFDDNTRSQLRRLQVSRRAGFPGRDLSHLVRNILPTCTNLVDLRIPNIADDWFKTFDPAGLVATTWVNRLEIYSGPPYPLNYLHCDPPLHQLESTAKVPSPMLQKLGRLLSQQLLALQIHHDVPRYLPQFGLIGKNHLPPSLVPSLFPNLRYVAWFLIQYEPGSVPGNIVRVI